MKAKIYPGGHLKIIAENETEEFALSVWFERKSSEGKATYGCAQNYNSKAHGYEPDNQEYTT